MVEEIYNSVLCFVIDKCFRAAPILAKKVDELHLWCQISQKFDFSKIKYFSFESNNIVPLFDV